MNKEQFIFWLKGFAKAVNEEGPTPGQWGIIASELNKIKDCPDFGSPIDEGGWGTPNLAPIQTLPFIQPADPYNPYKVYCGDTNLTVATGSSSTYGIITNGNTSWTNLPKDANVSYTSDSKEQ